MGRARNRANSSVATSAVSSAMSSRITSAAPSRASSPARKPFRFFDLPAELRLRIYDHVLALREPIDLDSLNYRRILPRLTLFLVSRRMHEEAYRVFYAQPIRLFPQATSRFFHTKKALLQRLPVRYREAIATMELRLGGGWSKPPRCQNVQPQLGLANCVHLRLLKIFVEIDPSDALFVGYRGMNATEDTYKWFCFDLLHGILDQVPSIEAVEIDAWPGVRPDSPLVAALRRKVEEFNKRLLWGPLRGFEKEDRAGPGLIGLESAMASLGLSGGQTPIPRVLQVAA